MITNKKLNIIHSNYGCRKFFSIRNKWINRFLVILYSLLLIFLIFVKLVQLRQSDKISLLKINFLEIFIKLSISRFILFTN